jgi:peroxiredoxin
MARRHDQIVGAGICEIVVFHSTAADMLPHQGQLPFAAVADPSRKLYRDFGVTASPRAVLHPKARTSPLNPRAYPLILRGRRSGGSPAPRHGDTALGLPADFLIEPDGRVREAKYGRHASDQWSVDELIRLARTRS